MPVSVETLRSDSAFFDQLVELIPAKYYFSTEASPEEKIDLRFLKKGEKEKARTEIKKRSKEAKRAQLNPATAKGTLEIQKIRAELLARKKEEANETVDGIDVDESGSSGIGEEREGSVTSGEEYEGNVSSMSTSSSDEEAEIVVPETKSNGKMSDEKRELLRQRLQEKLENFRKQRKADEQGKKAKDAKEWRNKTLNKSREIAAQKKETQKRKAGEAKSKKGEKVGPSTAEITEKQKSTKASIDNEDVVANLAFTRVEFNDNEQNKKKKRRRQSKEQILESLEQKQKSNEIDSKSNKSVGTEDWSAALARAKGEKVIDDAKLLRRSLKREEKIKKKKTEAWTERIEKQKEAQNARQNKRRENLQARAKQRKEKKKARREKKLLRAGFEGRKQDFIQTPTK